MYKSTWLILFMRDTSKKSYQHYIQMDGFRGFFCLIVFVVHHHYKFINLPISFGYFGMHGFFIISSFLISKNLIEQKNQINNFKDFFIIFYIKRSLRILPVYLIYISFIILVGIITYKTQLRSTLGIIYELKHYGWMLFSFTFNFKDLYSLVVNYIPNKSHLFSHLWSISLEEQFYVTIPFIVYFLSIKNLKRLTVFVILLIPIFRIIGYNQLESMTDNNMIRALILYHSTIFQYDSFFYGIFIVVFNINISIRNIKKLFYLLLLLFIISILLNGFLISNHENKPMYDIIYSYDFLIKNGQYIYMDILINILCAMFFYISFINADSFWFFKNKFLVFIGSKLSYSSYVYQYIFIIPTVLLLYPFLKNSLHISTFLSEIISMGISISMLLLLSNFSYKTMELYFLNKKGKYLAKYKNKT